MSLEDFKDMSARAAFGMTKSEAHEKKICIACKKPPEFDSELGFREYCISGICEPCWDAMFGGEDEEA